MRLFKDTGDADDPPGRAPVGHVGAAGPAECRRYNGPGGRDSTPNQAPAPRSASGLVRSPATHRTLLRTGGRAIPQVFKFQLSGAVGRCGDASSDRRVTTLWPAIRRAGVMGNHEVVRRFTRYGRRADRAAALHDSSRSRLRLHYQGRGTRPAEVRGHP